MYGIGGIDELENFFDLNENQQKFLQLTRGLLSPAGEPNHVLGEIISNGKDKAAQLGQFAQSVNPAAGNDLLAQRQNSTQQFAQQAMAQQQQQNARNGTLLMQIATMFFK